MVTGDGVADGETDDAPGDVGKGMVRIERVGKEDGFVRDDFKTLILWRGSMDSSSRATRRDECSLIETLILRSGETGGRRLAGYFYKSIAVHGWKTSDSVFGRRSLMTRSFLSSRKRAVAVQGADIPHAYPHQHWSTIACVSCHPWAGLRPKLDVTRAGRGYLMDGTGEGVFSRYVRYSSPCMAGLT